MSGVLGSRWSEEGPGGSRRASHGTDDVSTPSCSAGAAGGGHPEKRPSLVRLHGRTTFACEEGSFSREKSPRGAYDSCDTTNCIREDRASAGEEAEEPSSTRCLSLRLCQKYTTSVQRLELTLHIYDTIFEIWSTSNCTSSTRSGHIGRVRVERWRRELWIRMRGTMATKIQKTFRGARGRIFAAIARALKHLRFG